MIRGYIGTVMTKIQAGQFDVPLPVIGPSDTGLLVFTDADIDVEVTVEGAFTANFASPLTLIAAQAIVGPTTIPLPIVLPYLRVTTGDPNAGTPTCYLITNN